MSRSIRKTAAILAGGPSLNKGIAEAALASGAMVVVVNDSWKLAPTADILFACDEKWWAENPDAMKFSGQKIACQKVPDVDFVEPVGIRPGSNSALQATCWVMKYVDRVALFGVDLRDDQLTHWHGPGMVQPNASTFANARKAWNRVQPLCEIVNCNPRSSVKRFPIMSLEQALG